MPFPAKLAFSLSLLLVLGCEAETPTQCEKAIDTLAACERGEGDETICASDSEAATMAFSEECVVSSEKADLFGHRSIGEECTWDWQCSYDSGLLCRSDACDHIPVSSPCALPNESYLAETADRKQEALFALHQASPTVPLDNFTGALAALYRVTGIVAPHGAARITETFSLTCDVFREPSVKRVHALGTLAKANWVITEPGYTGLFAPGSVPALIRFSIANPVLGVSLPSFIPNLEFIPGIGIKLLVDGQPSENIVAMESLAGQGEDHNFFLHPFSNNFTHHAPTTAHPATRARYEENLINHETMKIIGTRFEQALAFVNAGGSSPFHRPATRLADVRVDGTDELIPAAPDYLVFRPTSDLRALSQVVDTDRNVDFRSKLAVIPVGTPVYEIVAVRGDDEQAIGFIELTSAPTSSEWADKSYFVQHAR